MPHDRTGKPLKQGDIVTIRCEVTNVAPGEDFCNLTLVTAEPMHPGTNKTTIVLNAKQVDLHVPVSPVEAAAKVEADRADSDPKAA